MTETTLCQGEGCDQVVLRGMKWCPVCAPIQPKIDQGTLIPITTDEVEQDKAIRLATKAALKILRTDKIAAFVLAVIVDNEDGTMKFIQGKMSGVHECMVVGMIEELKFGYMHQEPGTIDIEDD